MLGLSWEPLGVSLGNLEPSWGELEAVVGGFGGTSIFDDFFEQFWEQKESPKGSILGAKTEQKSIKKEVQIQERKGHLLESSWCDLGSISDASWGQTC